jgi:hypothetical protein
VERIELKVEGDKRVAIIDGHERETSLIDDDLCEVQVSLSELNGLTGRDLPSGLRLLILEDEGHPLFDTWLLRREQHRLIVESWADGSPMTIRKAVFKWNPAHLVHKAAEYLFENPPGDDVKVAYQAWADQPDEPFITIEQYKELASALIDAAREAIEWACRLMARVEATLAGKVWDPKYHTDEKLFNRELLIPLFQKMGFRNVRYGHGRGEYGKDITFSEFTPFGNIRHYAVQVKAGDVRGGAGSQIDDIIGQLDDAFSMPYFDISSDAPCYISTFIIAISGRFTENAKAKLAHKTRRGLYGSVWFLDRERILELVERWWWGKGDPSDRGEATGLRSSFDSYFPTG